MKKYFYLILIFTCIVVCAQSPYTKDYIPVLETEKTTVFDTLKVDRIKTTGVLDVQSSIVRGVSNPVQDSDAVNLKTLKDSINIDTSTFLRRSDSTILYVTPYQLNQYFTDAQYYEYELSSDGQQIISIPFILKTNPKIYVNRAILKSSEWSGSGTSNLVIGVSLLKYDIVSIVN